MKKAVIFPAKYIQGDGVLGEIGEIIAPLGCKKPMLVWGKRTKAAASETVLTAFNENGLDYGDWAFCGECTHEEAQAIADRVQKEGCDIIVGLGGGKALDVAKGAAALLGFKVICCPTVCSSDAPTSACSVWYDQDGVCTGFDLWPTNPDVVLVDTGIMVKGPETMLKAGIGDALATYFEAEASNRSHAFTCSGGTPTIAVMALAQLCLSTLLDDAHAALSAVQAGAVTPAFERVVEACTLLSGVGWESGGLATAHQLGNNLSAFPEAHHHMHGEKVCLGLLTQLILDPDVETEEIYDVVDFMLSLDLPVTWADLDMDGVSDERFMAFAVENTGENCGHIGNHSFTVTAKELYDAMKTVDEIGKSRKLFA